MNLHDLSGLIRAIEENKTATDMSDMLPFYRKRRDELVSEIRDKAIQARVFASAVSRNKLN